MGWRMIAHGGRAGGLREVGRRERRGPPSRCALRRDIISTRVASRMEAAGVEPARRKIANTVTARDFWAKRLQWEDLPALLHSSEGRWSTRVSTAVVETFWRRRSASSLRCSSDRLFVPAGLPPVDMPRDFPFRKY